MGKVKLPAHRAGLPGHASGEQNVSRGSFLHIVLLDPAYPALAGRGTFRPRIKILPRSPSCLVSAELPVCLGPPLPLEATVSYFLVDDPFEKFEHPVGLGFLLVEDFPCLVA